MVFEEEVETKPFSAAQEQSLWELARERAPRELAALDMATTEEQAFCALPQAAMAAWHLGNVDLARQLAHRLLGIARGYRDSWNFGNAICQAHNVLGLVALHEGDTEAAVRQLHEAGRTPGSPQLGSFGPTMQLARALALRGEFAAALAYLGQCRSFWHMGTIWLDVWEQKLLAGQVPHFFGAAHR